jgi:PAS domain S-box-containing protein
MPMVVSDPRKPDAPIILANQAFLDLSGYSAAEVIGRNCRFLQGPATDEADVKAIRNGLASGNDFVTIELLNYRKDGSSFWNELSISPVYDEHGELIYYFGSQKDVTARRRAQALEKAERTLLLEVDHRALNALAMVKSIVSLTRADTIERFSASVAGRVDALARAHQLLAGNGWASADFHDVLSGEIPAGCRDQVHLSGPETTIAAELVQSLTLVVHELMTNAVEHGSLGNGGTLDVSWERSPSQVNIRWRETGPVPPKTEQLKGFGHSIARGVVERQMGGRLDMAWASTGLDAAIFLPI